MRAAPRPHASIATEETRAVNRRLISILDAYDGGYERAAERSKVSTKQLPHSVDDAMPGLDETCDIARLVRSDLEVVELEWRTADDSQRKELHRRNRGRLRRRMLIGTALAAALGLGVGVPIVTAVGDSSSAVIGPAPGCFPGLVDRECGMPGQPVHALNPAFGLGPVVDDITRENERVYGSGSVSMAYVVTLPRDLGDLLAAATVRRALEGARDAQRRANAVGAGVPRLRILVVDVGTEAAVWRSAVVPGLVRQKDMPNRLVAVAGPAGDQPEAGEVVRTLVASGLPVFMSRPIAGPDPYLRPPEPAGVTPVAQVEAALPGPNGEGATGTVLVVRDITSEDDYVRALGDAADGVAARIGSPQKNGPRQFDGRAPGGPRMFDPAVREVCSTRTRAVYFAGQADDLLAFIDAVSARGCRSEGPVTILTGDDGVDAITALRGDPRVGDGSGEARNSTGPRAALERGDVLLRYTPGTVAPRVADNAADEGAISVDLASDCVRRAAGDETPPRPDRRSTVTANLVTQCYLAGGLPIGPVPLLAVARDGTTRPVATG